MTIILLKPGDSIEIVNIDEVEDRIVVANDINNGLYVEDENNNQGYKDEN